MARTLVMCDSFDHYRDPALKYFAGGGGAGIDLSGTLSRTGIGACILTQATGPELAVQPIRGTALGYMCCTAFFQVGNESSVSAGVFNYIDVDPGGGGDITNLFRCGVNQNLGLTCLDANGNVCAVSAPNIVVAQAYNIIEVKCFFVASGGGSAFVHLNGQPVVWTHGGLIGITTLIPSRSADGGECNFIQLGGAGGPAGSRHDDFTCWSSDQLNDSDFPGPVQVFAMVPVNNSSPLQWTPLSGTNYSEVNQVPPGEDLAYVSSSSVGNVDQYIYQPSSTIATPPTGVPIHPVLAGQHAILSRFDSGTPAVESDIAGVLGTSVPVTSGYFYSPLQPWGNNPSTSAPWNLATDFPATTAGPKQSA